ncbi:MAG: hypothetical protein LC624_10750 [Halobacteriales archaeon]|nr:hypothetical protein [Halobacteriales archaeon]
MRPLLPVAALLLTGCAVPGSGPTGPCIAIVLSMVPLDNGTAYPAELAIPGTYLLANITATFRAAQGPAPPAHPLADLARPGGRDGAMWLDLAGSNRTVDTRDELWTVGPKVFAIELRDASAALVGGTLRCV